MDLCGPIEIDSLGCANNYLIIKDEYTCFETNKAETVNKVKIFLNYAIKNWGHKVQIVRSDNWTELNKFKIFGSKVMVHVPDEKKAEM
ncbi:hypothetical protein PR048_012806 [Dryococelus australis]|uniref:Uncharacterized protein n=1 Tax=Dryococelus australis TaxID=614101 RepID=A0ABQ9HQF7_9NEOP|nr:hypothetical protein PR048_012806 [Dryococelus australis]